jgi:hypothetical protein
MNYELLSLNPDGTGQAQLTWDDGTACGQYFTGAPVDGDAVKLGTFLHALTAATKARLDAAAAYQAAIAIAKPAPIPLATPVTVALP